jgi:hypothetical protein
MFHDTMSNPKVRLSVFTDWHKKLKPGATLTTKDCEPVIRESFIGETVNIENEKGRTKRLTMGLKLLEDICKIKDDDIKTLEKRAKTAELKERMAEAKIKRLNKLIDVLQANNKKLEKENESLLRNMDDGSDLLDDSDISDEDEMSEDDSILDEEDE